MIGYWYHTVCLSLCLSVMLSVVTKHYIPQQKCPNNWIGSPPKECNFVTLNPLHQPCSLKVTTPKFSRVSRVKTQNSCCVWSIQTLSKLFYYRCSRKLLLFCVLEHVNLNCIIYVYKITLLLHYFSFSSSILQRFGFWRPFWHPLRRGIP